VRRDDLDALVELVDYCKCCLVRQAALRADSSTTHDCERILDRVGQAQMFPVLRGEVAESEQRRRLAPTESPRRNRGHPVHWGDGRYILLEGLVFQIKRELEHKNGPGKPRVSDKQAVKALRKRYPAKWGVYPEKTLVARFYDARRRLHEICVAYDHDAATTGNQD
jgi:hypothetical protein